MEKHFLDNLMSDEGAPEFRPEPWYNPEGDCIIYETANEAVIADRIDEILTVYRSATDDRPIGFEIKGIQAILMKFGWDGLAVSSESHEGEVTSISIAALLLAAYEDGPKNISRRHAYASAIASPPHQGLSAKDLVPA